MGLDKFIEREKQKEVGEGRTSDTCLNGEKKQKMRMERGSVRAKWL